MLNREQRILQKLSIMSPVQISLKNNSAAHAGHVQHLGPEGFTGETHYQLFIVCNQFKDLSRIDRQRMVMNLLKEEFLTGLHALEIKAQSPEEI